MFQPALELAVLSILLAHLDLVGRGSQWQDVPVIEVAALGSTARVLTQTRDTAAMQAKLNEITVALDVPAKRSWPRG
ncbi:MAG: hypothetical protein E5W93_09725 [Mesorhizobium sp.]|nr:MAG: hypothetical protein E5W93_09725 [Mesorhizobium sp.]